MSEEGPQDGGRSQSRGETEMNWTGVVDSEKRAQV